MSFWSSGQALFPFQMESVAKIFWKWTNTEDRVGILGHQTGLGKTPSAIALACFLLEDGLIDHVVVVAEANKCLDWVENDFPKFSTLKAVRYSGTPAKRKKILQDLPQVLVTSYETARQDICSFRGRRAHEPKMLTEILEDKRILFVFDEFSKLRTRTSRLYVGWEFLLNRMRKAENSPYCVGLTATMVEKSPEDMWNAGRLLSPERAGAVGKFYSNYVASYDSYNLPKNWKNLSSEDCAPGVTPLNQIFSDITVRKMKTDPDVIEQFPSKIENPPIMVDLSESHRALYDAVEAMFSDPEMDENTQRIGFGILRQIVNHPASLTRSQGQYSRQIVETVGAAYLHEMPSAKLQALLDWQERMSGQSTVIFTFHGQSVLPFIEQALVSKGYSVSVNHGGMTQEQRQKSQITFKAGDSQIFLSSDAGARGLNLGCGSGLIHYECPVLWSVFEQRSNRIHRLDTIHPSVTIDSLVAARTLEIPVYRLMLRRAKWGEQVQDSDLEESEEGVDFLKSDDRMRIFNRSL